MISRRSAKGSYYECRECGNRIHPATYRASCPECAGRLRSIRATPDGAGPDHGPAEVGDRR